MGRAISACMSGISHTWYVSWRVKSMEKNCNEEKVSDRAESGYSEKQNDLDAEIRAGEWQSLRRYKTYQQRSRQGKILATYQAISNRLNQLVQLYYKFVASNPKQAEKMLKELQELRLMQEILLN